jgi:predicted DCC family thiol-disulfide oxidoreductase YuxK
MSTPSQRSATPILLYNDECGVCRRIAAWVARSARKEAGQAHSVTERPIGSDPESLRALSPNLDIWDAYATLHLLMPDGSMKLGGEAVAEVLRRLPATRWFAWAFAVDVFGFRPFQAVLNVCYAILAGVRPLLGCESCSRPSTVLRPFVWLIKRAKALFGAPRARGLTPHFAPRPALPLAKS